MILHLVKGWYLPDWDNHYEKMLKEYNGKWEYQKDTRDYALGFVKNFRTALDIGGNIGFWSVDLCDKFNEVISFEPHPHNIECYKRNLTGKKNWTLEEVALADHQEKGATLFQSPDESGNVSLVSSGVENGNTKRKLKPEQLKKSTTDVVMLDDYLKQFEGKNIDFIKVDCQAHEKEIVSGGLELLNQHDAVVCLELPLRNPDEVKYHDEVVDIMSTIGYIRRGNMRKETIFTR